MRKNYLLLLILLPIHCLSQSTFMRTYGGTVNDEGWYFFEDNSGNFVICGDSGRVTSQNYTGDVYLFMVDSQGNTLWSKTYGDSSSDLARCVQPTLDGGYILFGDHNMMPQYSNDAFLIKTSGAGDSLWSRVFIGAHSNRLGISIVPLPDSGFVLGTINDDITWYNPYQILKINSTGGPVWLDYQDMIYSTYFGGYGSSLKLTNDGGLIIGGTNEINLQTQDVMSLTKTDSMGNIQWYKEFTGFQNCDGACVWQCYDDGFIVAGSTNSYGVGGWDMYVIRTDSSGDSLWAKTFGGSGNESISAIQQTADSGYILFGTSNSFGSGDDDIILLKLDYDGDSLWQKSFGGAGGEVARHGILTHDGGFAVVGYTSSLGAGANDVVFIKTDSLGIITTSLQNSLQKQQYHFFPNPTSNSLNIVCPIQEFLVIECFSPDGKCVYSYSGNVNEGVFTISTDNFLPGLYFVKLGSSTGEPEKHIMIKF